MYEDYLGKAITPRKLRVLLKQLPEDILLACNQVGNISVYSKNCQFLGFIDLGAEELQMIDLEIQS